MNSSFPALQIQINDEEMAAVQRFLAGITGTDVEAAKDEETAKGVLRRFLGVGPNVWTAVVLAVPEPGPFGAKSAPRTLVEEEVFELLEEQTADPTQWRFPKLTSPNRATHIAKLEQALGRLKARIIFYEEEAERVYKTVHQLRQDRDHLDQQHRTLLQEKNSLQAQVNAIGKPEAAQPASDTWPTVAAFAARMERKLDMNRHKGDRANWLKDEPEALMERLRQETHELAVELEVAAVRMNEPFNVAWMAQRLADEAADVANFAMMIADWHLEVATRKASLGIP